MRLFSAQKQVLGLAGLNFSFNQSGIRDQTSGCQGLQKVGKNSSPTVVADHILDSIKRST